MKNLLVLSLAAVVLAGCRSPESSGSVASKPAPEEGSSGPHAALGSSTPPAAPGSSTPPAAPGSSIPPTERGSDGAPSWTPPSGCHAAPSPNAGPAFDCEDGSFTLEEGLETPDVEAELERRWHEALALVEVVHGEIGATRRLTCLVEGDELSCLRVGATLPGGERLRIWLAADATRAVECSDLRGVDGLHPVCAPWLIVPGGEGVAYP